MKCSGWTTAKTGIVHLQPPKERWPIPLSSSVSSEMNSQRKYKNKAKYWYSVCLVFGVLGVANVATVNVKCMGCCQTGNTQNILWQRLQKLQCKYLAMHL